MAVHTTDALHNTKLETGFAHSAFIDVRTNAYMRTRSLDGPNFIKSRFLMLEKKTGHLTNRRLFQNFRVVPKLKERKKEKRRNATDCDIFPSPGGR